MNGSKFSSLAPLPLFLNRRETSRKGTFKLAAPGNEFNPACSEKFWRSDRKSDELKYQNVKTPSSA